MIEITLCSPFLTSYRLTRNINVWENLKYSNEQNWLLINICCKILNIHILFHKTSRTHSTKKKTIHIKDRTGVGLCSLILKEKWFYDCHIFRYYVKIISQRFISIWLPRHTDPRPRTFPSMAYRYLRREPTTIFSTIMRYWIITNSGSGLRPTSAGVAASWPFNPKTPFPIN